MHSSVRLSGHRGKGRATSLVSTTSALAHWLVLRYKWWFTKGLGFKGKVVMVGIYSQVKR